MSTIKFRKCFSKFIIPIALLEKFGRSTCISSVEVHYMIADHKKHDEERHHPKTENLLYERFSNMGRLDNISLIIMIKRIHEISVVAV